MSKLTHEKATWAIETLEEFWFQGVTIDYSTLTCVGEEGELVYYEVGVTNADGEEGTLLVTFKEVDDCILSHEVVDYEFEEMV